MPSLCRVSFCPSFGLPKIIIIMARSTSSLLFFAAAAILLMILPSEAFFFSRMPSRLQQASKSPQLALFG